MAKKDALDALRFFALLNSAVLSSPHPHRRRSRSRVKRLHELRLAPEQFFQIDAELRALNTWGLRPHSRVRLWYM